MEDVVDQGVSSEVEESTQPAGAWYDSLDPDLRNDPNVTKFDSVDKLAKSYREIQKAIGKDKVVLPNDKSTPEEWQQFYSKLGRPESFDKYSTPELEIDDKIRMNDNVLESFKSKAHELGLNNKQFAELYSLYHEVNQNNYNSMLENQTQMIQKTETELRGEWGSAYDSKIDAANKIVKEAFGDLLNQENEEQFNFLANQRWFIQGMSKLADKVGEDILQGNPSRGTLTPDEAQSQLNNIIMDKSHPFHDSAHPEHKAAMDKFIALQQMSMTQ